MIPDNNLRTNSFRLLILLLLYLYSNKYLFKWRSWAWSQGQVQIPGNKGGYFPGIPRSRSMNPKVKSQGQCQIPYWKNENFAKIIKIQIQARGSENNINMQERGCLNPTRKSKTGKCARTPIYYTTFAVLFSNKYSRLLFHYCVILPYKVKRMRKIRGRNTL